MAISRPNGEEVVINSGGLLIPNVEVGNSIPDGEVLNPGGLLKPPCSNGFTSRDM